MEAIKIQTLFDVDVLVDKFLQEHSQGIATIHRMNYHHDDPLSLAAYKAELFEELKTGCVTFWNKNHSVEGLDSYLFYIANAVCKKRAHPVSKKKTEYLCPGCLFLGKENLIISAKVFECDECGENFKSSSDPKMKEFFQAFYKHSKAGFRCPDCERFIPQPLDESSHLVCPYIDCAFVGNSDDLKKMHHPTSQSNPEKLVLDLSRDGKSSMKDSLVSQEIGAQTKLEVEEDLRNKVKLIQDVIDSQKNYVPYSSSGFTSKHKYLCYQAFSNLLKKYPAEMVGYLIGNSRSGGFQAKAFQEYIRLLEESFPFTYEKDKKPYLVDSLLDDKLSLFNGISVFDGLVNERLIIENETKEFYIGGRKGAVAEPYYIGKLLNIVNQKTKESLMDRVVEYSFLRIKMRDVDPGTSVIVTHLRVPPHYQMGGMVYVNRVRKKITERLNSLLNKENEE